MLDLESVLRREGLPPGTRALLAANSAIYPADWDRFAASITAAREHGVPRAHAEEMLLQSILYFGFPRAITAFDCAQQAWPAPTPPTGAGLPPDQQAAAGRAMFDTIYAANSRSVRDMLLSMHGELHDFVLRAAYGRILTRPQLEPRSRELLAVNSLEALQQVPQLIAHARGALAYGATSLEVREAVFTARLDDEGIDELMRRIERK